MSFAGFSAFSGSVEAPSITPLTEEKPEKLIVLRTPGWAELDDGSRSEFNRLSDELARLGIDLTGADTDAKVAAFEQTLARHDDEAPDIVACEMRWPFGGYIARDAPKVSQRIHEMVARGIELGNTGYRTLLENRRRAQLEAAELLSATSASGFITLASSGPAPVGLANTGSRRFLNYASWLGIPAVALPLMQVGHLPVGLQLIGGMHKDGAMARHASWILRQLGKD